MLDEASHLDLSTWPPIYVSNTHFDTDELHELEEELTNTGALLTYDVKEAEIILSKVTQKKRIQFDLRAKGLFTKEAQLEKKSATVSPYGKKRKRDQAEDTLGHETDAIVIDDSTTASEGEPDSRTEPSKLSSSSSRQIQQHAKSTHKTPSPCQDSGRIVKVVGTAWFTKSKEGGRVQDLDKYITYTGRSVERAASAESPVSRNLAVRSSGSISNASKYATAPQPVINTAKGNILQRARDDAPKSASKPYDRFGRRKFGLNTPSANPSSWEAGHGTSGQYAHLLQQTTTENEGGSSSDVPEPPEWVKRGVKYACQRLTPKTNPNDPFIEQLKKIKLARLLTNDEIGVRAYSTSIASLAAYTYKITNPREILALPGCDSKIANLFVEWTNTGMIKAVDDLEADEDLEILKTFYNIWGVGATTARDFLYQKCWREMDNVIEYGWEELSRVQKIGVKYYDEFLDLIPRGEVEQIADIIHRRSVEVRDSRIQTMIVGGYRRGKEASGDVDIIVSHPDESATLNLVEDIVNSLEQEDWITHTLIISTKSSERDQQTLPFRAGGGGHGFDTLDKALVVWQDPVWPTKERDLAKNPKAKNPNIHRRVDIILSPWRTVGCAIVGWSGGTTFQRDLRRYAKNVRSWKFDSSGVRDRRNGEVVDIEGYYQWQGQDAPACRAQTMEEAEKRVFEGFGLTYREPWERCTG